jgi:hypothetical protein
VTGVFRQPTYEEWSPTLGVELEPGQRELVRVGLDGRAPAPVDPAWRSPVLGHDGDIFGFKSAPPMSALRVFTTVAGIRSGKSLIVGAGYSVYQAATAVVRKEDLAHGEEVYCSFQAPKQEKAIETMAYALGVILNRPELRARLIGRAPTSNRVEHFFFRALGGGKIKFTAVAAGGGNIGGAGRWHLNACVDEYGLLKSGTYKVNDKDIFNGLRPRLWRRSGDRYGRMQLVGSPWAKEGHLWELCDGNYWNPIECVVAQAATDVLRTDPSVLGNMAELYAIAKATGTLDTFLRDYGARFLSLGSVRIYDDEAIRRCPRSKRGDVRPGDVLVVGIDLGFSYDHAAIVVVRVRWETVEGQLVKTYAVVDYDEVEPESGVLPRPSVICRRFIAMMKRYGARYAMADQHYVLTLQEELARPGVDEQGRALGALALVRAPADNMLPHMRWAQLMAEGRASLLDDARFLHQMTLPQRKPSGSKTWQLVMPRTRGQGHADIAAAGALAFFQAAGTEVPTPPPTAGTAAWLAAREEADLAAEERDDDDD